ncbi:hypothetical protein IEQ34_004387 [Dendrobium chrysotoxum]|uniref:Uncharacterized protein n=1 Tax=Dendrobium chrysotoxum TaxID=161865 RepID=A0AAV7HH46_DENCH|nr:hypothetical protein IEQ34_004387 [Dendrobium chrysotoxum]
MSDDEDGNCQARSRPSKECALANSMVEVMNAARRAGSPAMVEKAVVVEKVIRRGSCSGGGSAMLESAGSSETE